MSDILNRLLVGIALVTLPTALSPASGEPGPAAAQGYASEVPSYVVRDDQSGTFSGEDQATLPIAQTVDFIVNQHVQQRGGYDSLKRIVSLDYYGARFVRSVHYPLHVHAARPDISDTLVDINEASKFESSRSGGTIRIEGGPLGFAIEGERELLETFDFDGAIVDWKEKHYAIKRLGMEKLPGVLAWKLQVDRPDGYRQILYLDSRYGDVVKELLLNAAGTPIVEIARSDFRTVEGSRFSFAIDYKSPGGDTLVSDRIERIEVVRKPG
jgi:hypothetical protein